jgi:transposase-like protein
VKKTRHSEEQIIGVLKQMEAGRKVPESAWEAAMKLLYMALEHIAKKWTMPVRNWKAALQRFAIMFGDRVPPAETA